MPASSHPAPVAVRLRRATASDLPALVALENASFIDHKLNERRLRHWIGADNGILLLAVHGAALLGACLVLRRADSRAARLYSIAISSAARGQGLGGKLLHRAEAIARAEGCLSMRLEVSAGNHVAIGLYQKRGYVIFGRKPAYYEDGHDALRMQKFL